MAHVIFKSVVKNKTNQGISFTRGMLNGQTEAYVLFFSEKQVLQALKMACDGTIEIQSDIPPEIATSGEVFLTEYNKKEHKLKVYVNGGDIGINGKGLTVPHTKVEISNPDLNKSYFIQLNDQGTWLLYPDAEVPTLDSITLAEVKVGNHYQDIIVDDRRYLVTKSLSPAASGGAAIDDAGLSTFSTWSSLKIQESIEDVGGLVMDDSITSIARTWSSNKIQTTIQTTVQSAFTEADGGSF